MSVFNTDSVVSTAPLIPVLQLDNPETAVPIAQTLVESGLAVLEVTLRTPGALACIEAIARALPEAQVGAGTLLAPEQVSSLVDAGGRFAVSPGLTLPLFEACQAAKLPWLPGVVTPSELLSALGLGFLNCKFFPAAAYGGTATLKSFAGPFPAARFCPTGGITPANLADYLRLSNVVCAGGSWLVTREDAIQPDLDAIRARATEALAVAGAVS